MTHDERMKIIGSIRCNQCRHFAWHSFMMPVQVGIFRRWHHPSCVEVTGPRKPPPGPRPVFGRG
jgi:hypothetical protein